MHHTRVASISVASISAVLSGELTCIDDRMRMSKSQPFI